ncbi:unnamed protein product, partial [Staurois parvus]
MSGTAGHWWVALLGSTDDQGTYQCPDDQCGVRKVLPITSNCIYT